MATTAVDVKELATSYVFIADMPGLKHTDIKVSYIILNNITLLMTLGLCHSIVSPYKNILSFASLLCILFTFLPQPSDWIY